MEPASPSRIVRFDSECVLIPDSPSASKLPFVLTKSYSLPLWKNDQDESRVVIRVPIPHFRRRASPSPGPRGRSVSSSPVVSRAPLPSCLVHPDAPTLAAPLRPVRRTSLPSKDDPALLTVPLRPCCAACEAATDDAIAEGEAWQIHFTRGAKRRRSASLEQPLSSPTPFGHLNHLPPPPSASLSRTFPGLSADLDPSEELYTVRGGAAVATAFALRVDEVEQRRRSFSFSHEEEHYAALRRHAGSPPPPMRPVVSLTLPSTSTERGPGLHAPHLSPYGTFLAPEGYRLRASPIAEEDNSARNSSLSLSSNASVQSNVSARSSGSARSTEARAASPPRRTSKSTRRINVPVLPTPGADDDDDELFPLPRRSPSASPSPRASPLSGGGGCFGGGGISPGGSTNSLTVPGRAPCEPSTPIDEESAEGEDGKKGILGASLNRRTGLELRIQTAPSTPRQAATPPATPPLTKSSSIRRPVSPRGPRPPGPLPTNSSQPIPIPRRKNSTDAHFRLPSLHIPVRAHNHDIDSAQPKIQDHSSGAQINSQQIQTQTQTQGSPPPHRRGHSLAATFVRAGADMLRGVGGLSMTGGVGSA